MKTNLKLMAGVAAALIGLSAQAIPIDSGTSILASSSVPGNTLTVDYNVDLTAGIYTYSYVLNNPLGDTTSPDFFNVSFDALAPGAVIAGNYLLATSAGVDWVLAPVAPGASSSTLFFTSLLAPVLGNAGAQDHTPPSPWATTTSGGTRLDIPNVPDGGMTVGLLGLALGVCGMVARKMKKA